MSNKLKRPYDVAIEQKKLLFLWVLFWLFYQIFFYPIRSESIGFSIQSNFESFLGILIDELKTKNKN